VNWTDSLHEGQRDELARAIDFRLDHLVRDLRIWSVPRPRLGDDTWARRQASYIGVKLYRLGALLRDLQEAR